MSACAPHSCAGCRHFSAEPAAIEASMPGLRVLSSAYAAVRAGDGLCGVHQRYVAAYNRCAAHEALSREERQQHDAHPPDAEAAQVVPGAMLEPLELLR